MVSEFEWQRVEGVSGWGRKDVSASAHACEICRARLRERLVERYGEAAGQRFDAWDLAGDIGWSFERAVALWEQAPTKGSEDHLKRVAAQYVDEWPDQIPDWIARGLDILAGVER